MDQKHPLATSTNAEALFEQGSRRWDLTNDCLVEKSLPSILRTRFFRTCFPKAASSSDGSRLRNEEVDPPIDPEAGGSYVAVPQLFEGGFDLPGHITAACADRGISTRAGSRQLAQGAIHDAVCLPDLAVLKERYQE